MCVISNIHESSWKFTLPSDQKENIGKEPNSLLKKFVEKKMLSIAALTAEQRVEIEEKNSFSCRELREYVEIEKVHNRLCFLAGLARIIPAAKELFKKFDSLDKWDWKARANLVSQWFNFKENKESLKRIKKINLSNLGLTQVPQEISLLLNCKKIDLRNNCLHSVHELGCKKLKALLV